MAFAMLSLAEFVPHIDSIFVLINENHTEQRLRLTQATSLPVYPGIQPARAPFELFFNSAVQEVLPQSLYALDHATMGRLEIFLVPTSRDDSGVTYCATFN